MFTFILIGTKLILLVNIKVYHSFFKSKEIMLILSQKPEDKLVAKNTLKMKVHYRAKIWSPREGVHQCGTSTLK